MLFSSGVFGLAAGPVPWIHWRRRSAGISPPANFPSRASGTLIRVRGIRASGSRNPIRRRSRALSALRQTRASIRALRSGLNLASSPRAACASGVRMSAYWRSRPARISRPEALPAREWGTFAALMLRFLLRGPERPGPADLYPWRSLTYIQDGGLVQRPRAGSRGKPQAVPGAAPPAFQEEPGEGASPERPAY